MKLQPIETAPRDGTRILAIARQVHGPFITRWWTSWHGLSGWNGPFGIYGSFIDGITHWMPLPEPPKIAGGHYD